jgi:hypothetical protein
MINKFLYNKLVEILFHTFSYNKLVEKYFFIHKFILFLYLRQTFIVNSYHYFIVCFIVQFISKFIDEFIVIS